MLLVGDSVTVESTRAIVESFNHIPPDVATGRYAPTFGSTVVGQGLVSVPYVPSDAVDEYWPTHLASLMEHVDPEVIVVELGYNDCGNLAGYGDRIDGFMAAIPGSTPVHWLTMADPRKAKTCDATINAELRKAVTRHANLSLFDFAAFLNPHPAWTRDGTHLTTEGQRQYAGWLRVQLDALYASGG